MGVVLIDGVIISALEEKDAEAFLVDAAITVITVMAGDHRDIADIPPAIAVTPGINAAGEIGVDTTIIAVVCNIMAVAQDIQDPDAIMTTDDLYKPEVSSRSILIARSAPSISLMK